MHRRLLLCLTTWVLAAGALFLTAVPADGAAVFDPRWATVLDRLDAVHAALTRHRAQHGAHPRELSGLFPGYLTNASDLLDPFAPPFAPGVGPDAPAPVSLDHRTRWELVYSESGGIEEFGGHYAIVRAGRQRGLGVMNLSLSGHVVFTPPDASVLATILCSEEDAADERAVTAAIDTPPPPPGYAPSTRLLSDLNGVVAAIEEHVGDTAARHHAEGVLRAWNHDLAGAERALRIAVAREPDGVRALYHHARLLHRLERNADAMSAYERAIVTGDPDDPQWVGAHEHLPGLLIAAGAAARHGDLVRQFEGVVASDAVALLPTLLAMYRHAGSNPRAMEVGEAFYQASAENVSRAAASLLADVDVALGDSDAAERYRRLANPALALVNKRAPRVVGYPVGRVPMLMSLSLEDGGGDRDERTMLLESLWQEYAGEGLVVLNGTTSRRAAADPWWRETQREVGHAIEFDMAHAYKTFGVERAAVLVIDADGFVRYVTAAPTEDDDALADAVRASLAAYRSPATHSILRLHGRAQDRTGAPVVGATIDLYYYDNRHPEYRRIARAASGADGSFTIHTSPQPLGDADLGSQRFPMIARAEGWSLGLHSGGGLSPGRTVNALIEFTPPQDIAGRVLDRAGAPIVGARISVLSMRIPERVVDGRNTGGRSLYSCYDRAGPLSTVSAADGSYAFADMPEGARVSMVVVHQEFAEKYLLVESGVGLVTDAHLMRGAVVEGVVYETRVAADGTRAAFPAAGADIHIWTAHPAALAAWGYGEEAWQVERPDAYGASVVTDAAGRYRVDQVPAGFVSISAGHGETTSLPWDAYRITEGGAHTADLYLIPTGTILGRLVDADTGEAIGHGSLPRAKRHGPSYARSGRGEFLHVDEDGAFELRAAPGVNSLYFDAPAGWAWVDDVTQLRPFVFHVVAGKTAAATFRFRRLVPTAGR